MDHIATHVDENNPFPSVEQFKCFAYLSKSINTKDKFINQLDLPYPCQVDITLIITSSVIVYTQRGHH